MIETPNYSLIRLGPHSGIPRETLLRPCLKCGSAIPKHRFQSWNDYAKRSFCSHRCNSDYRIAEKHPKWKHERPEHPCKQCGNPIETLKSLPPSMRKKKFCSHDCLRKYHKHGETLENGYVPGHGARFEHIAIAERALGRKFKKGEIVHHLNGVRNDNRNRNLLICTQSYHRWLHNEMGRRYMVEHFGEGQSAL